MKAGRKHVLVFLFLITGVPGCLFVPYAFPTFFHTPELKVNADSDQVLAIWAKRKYEWVAIALSVGPQESYEFTRCLLLTNPQASLESQTDFGAAYGIAGLYCFPMALFLPAPGWTISKEEQVLLLYRPGFRLKRIDGWSWEKTVEWEPAQSTEEQIEALRGIASCSHSRDSADCGPLMNLLHGIATRLHWRHEATSELSLEESKTYHEFMQMECARLAKGPLADKVRDEFAIWCPQVK